MKYHFPNSPYLQYIEALENLQKEFDQKREALRQTLRNAQKLCKHENATYHPDPSGNNDSYIECNECGKRM